MLIDAAHREETRVAVLRGNKIEEFDFESAARKQLRGNIYLAKVTRVEPSLQAAFVDYGGNRHGFLAFSEIHPDYYQIPVADRQALLEQDAADDIADQADENANGDGTSKDDNDTDGETTSTIATASGDDEKVTGEVDAEDASEDGTEGTDDDSVTVEAGAEDDTDDSDSASDDDEAETSDDDDTVDIVAGAEDALTEIPPRRRARERRYKIQEVIKRRQIILVQVVKEERGTKGAALTSYLSLAGRYCVLMPNTARGGGISRKITQAADRRKLKDVANSLEVPAGTGLIIRTAGAKRTKAEIKRDFEYLLRLWETVRDLTLESTAPCLVYEEGSLIKRSIRDLYNKDVDEIIIEGEEGYKEAKSFMRMLMPSHAKNVQQYKGGHPLFARHQIEGQLDGMFQPRVTLKSGGYLIINQTEALVAVDVNSGRATREHHIEDTALNTNLEAAEEVSRQMRLRDLAGLIVIDFIDMEERRNNRAVERKLKESLKHDRARIQVGRISHFGLLEMSRQRMRSGVVEGSTQQCAHCQGRGLVRSVESASLFVLRAIEEYVLKNNAEDLVVSASQDVAFYILNQKREHLLSLQQNYNITLFINARSDLLETAFEIARAGDNALAGKSQRPATQPTPVVAASPENIQTEATPEDDENKGKRRRRRRRRGGRNNRRDNENVNAAESGAETTSQDEAEQTDVQQNSQEDRTESKSADDMSVADTSVADTSTDDTSVGDGSTDDKPARRPRRRRSSRAAKASGDEAVTTDVQEAADTESVPEAAASSEDAEDKPKPRRRRSPLGRGRGRRPAKSADDASETAVENVDAKPDSDVADVAAPEAKAVEDDKPAKPKRRTRRKPAPKSDDVAAQEAAPSSGNGADKDSPAPEPAPEVPAAPAKPRKTGWWQRK